MTLQILAAYVVILMIYCHAVNEYLDNYEKGDALIFGIKVSTNHSIQINPDIYLTLFFAKYQYQCRFTPMVVTEPSEWPWMYYWCNIESPQATYCDNNENNHHNIIDGYSIMLTNHNDIPLIVDQFVINRQESNEDVISIDKFNAEDTIKVSEMSVIIDLNHEIYNDMDYQTYEPIINAKCSDIDIWHIYVMNGKSQSEAQSFCENMYGTDLGTIDNEEKLRIALELEGHMHADVAWMGYIEINGVWRWIDGTNCTYLNDSDCANDPFWILNEPNALQDETCATVNEHGKGGWFNNIECWHRYTFFCNFHNNSVNIAKQQLETDISTITHHESNGQIGIFIFGSNSNISSTLTDDISLYPTSTTIQEERHEKSGMLIAIVVVSAFVLLILVIIIVCLYYHKKKRNYYVQSQEIEHSSDGEDNEEIILSIEIASESNIVRDVDGASNTLTSNTLSQEHDETKTNTDLTTICTTTSTQKTEFTHLGCSTSEERKLLGLDVHEYELLTVNKNNIKDEA